MVLPYLKSNVGAGLVPAHGICIFFMFSMGGHKGGPYIFYKSRRNGIIIALQIIEYEPRMGEMILVPLERHYCNKLIIYDLAP